MEIHAADPRAKRTAILLLVAGLILGTTLILFFDRARPEIARWIVADTQQVRFRAGVVLSLVAVVVVGPLIGLAAYLYRLGAASARAERFPPPGAAMLYDTPVVSGHAARTRGRALQAIGVTLIAVAIAIAVLLWTVASVRPNAV